MASSSPRPPPSRGRAGAGAAPWCAARSARGSGGTRRRRSGWSGATRSCSARPPPRRVARGGSLGTGGSPSSPSPLAKTQARTSPASPRRSSRRSPEPSNSRLPLCSLKKPSLLSTNHLMHGRF
uniref:Uncharacterized protein n=1 Tax=Arundo donax TaxID=35708 RepID=A0A0A9E4D6_ARUDO